MQSSSLETSIITKFQEFILAISSSYGVGRLVAPTKDYLCCGNHLTFLQNQVISYESMTCITSKFAQDLKWINALNV